MNKLGVVVCNYNYGHLLDDALSSIRAQEGIDPDVLVLDDHSDANSVNPYEVATKHRARLLCLPESRGLGVTRNIGVAYLNTEYWVPLDADDWFLPGALRAMVAALDGDPSADMVYGNYMESDCVEYGKFERTKNWTIPGLRLNSVTSYCEMWRTKAFWSVGGYSDITVAEDWELQRRAIAAGIKAVHIEDKVFFHRLHLDSKWNRDRKVVGIDKLKEELAVRSPL
jgi:hypothetical protein